MNAFRSVAVAGTAGLLALTGLTGTAAASSAASGRPDCPDYVEQNRDWVQFSFTDGEQGATWRKTATMTQRARSSESEARSLARRMQICFEAPYSFPTRPGYRLGRSGDWYVGVLADCGSVARKHPCLLRREVMQRSSGWQVRLTFLVPPSPEDPKALG